VSYQRPKFTQGVYGGLTRPVMQDMQRAGDVIRDQAGGDAIAWANTRRMEGNSVSMGLVEITGATLISGASYRWNYSVKLWHPAGAGGITLPSTDSRFTYTNALNLRELYNTATLVDGVTVNATPTDQFGPVGSYFTGGAWATQYSARVQLFVVYNTAGAAWPYFDRPNPYRCI
jgi:hypothetical protein